MPIAGSNAGGGGSGLYGVIFLSLLAHFLLLSLLVFSPALLPRPKLTFGPVYDVQLVSMPEGSSAKNAGEAAMRDVLEGLPSQQPVLSKTSLDTLPAAVPIHPLQTGKKPDNSLDDVLEAMRKKLPSPPKPLVAAPALPEASRLKGGESVDGEFNARLRGYYTQIWGRIKGAWTIPRGLVSQERIEAVINVRILRDGTITGVDLEKSSGNRYFDDSVLRAVRKANPLPPPPETLEDGLEVGIRFRPDELR